MTTNPRLGSFSAISLNLPTPMIHGALGFKTLGSSRMSKRLHLDELQRLVSAAEADRIILERRSSTLASVAGVFGSVTFAGLSFSGDLSSVSNELGFARFFVIASLASTAFAFLTALAAARPLGVGRPAFDNVAILAEAESRDDDLVPLQRSLARQYRLTSKSNQLRSRVVSTGFTIQMLALSFLAIAVTVVVLAN